MKKKLVEVTYLVEVEYDETKFTNEWMKEFKDYMYPFNTIDDHIKHLASKHSITECYPDAFIEGYGFLKEFGVSLKVQDVETEIVYTGD